MYAEIPEGRHIEMEDAVLAESQRVLLYFVVLLGNSGTVSVHCLLGPFSCASVAIQLESWCKQG